MSFDLKIENGDIKLSQDGLVDIVVDNQKLRQDIVKIMLTALGENKYHPRYGSDVGSLTIGSVADQNLLEIDLESSAREALRKLIALQSSQGRRQFLSPGERILSILGLSVERDITDPRLYSIFISIQTGAITTITESITVRLV